MLRGGHTTLLICQMPQKWQKHKEAREKCITCRKKISPSRGPEDEVRMGTSESSWAASHSATQNGARKQDRDREGSGGQSHEGDLRGRRISHLVGPEDLR